MINIIIKCFRMVAVAFGFVLIANCLMASTSDMDVSLSEKIVEWDTNKDGVNDYRRKEIWRGTNLILTTIWHDGSISRAFTVGEYVFLEHDADGDGLFEQVAILKENNVYEAYTRELNGQVKPYSSARLIKLQVDSYEAKNIITSLVDAVTSKNSDKVDQVLEQIQRRYNSPVIVQQDLVGTNTAENSRASELGERE